MTETIEIPWFDFLYDTSISVKTVYNKVLTLKIKAGTRQEPNSKSVENEEQPMEELEICLSLWMQRCQNSHSIQRSKNDRSNTVSGLGVSCF